MFIGISGCLISSGAYMVPLIKAMIVTDDKAHKRWGEDDVFPVLIATKQLASRHIIRKYYKDRHEKWERYAKERMDYNENIIVNITRFYGHDCRC